jgi:hypothetical protein
MISEKGENRRSSLVARDSLEEHKSIRKEERIGELVNL